MSAETIATIWAFLIATAVFLYVCMDGFDLGVGILFPWIHGREDRDLAVNTVAPVWDGNETWLILGGGGLFGVFPLAYATIMPAVYMPIIIMLLALIFRGVAFEMRFRAATPGQLRWWDRSFSGGSYVATFAQGRGAGRAGAGDPGRGPRLCRGLVGLALALLGLSPASALVAGYGMLGACWLVWKTEGEMQAQVRDAGPVDDRADARLHRPGQPGGALPAAGLPRPLVRLSGDPGGAAGAGAGGGADLAAVARPGGGRDASGRPARGLARRHPLCVCLGLFFLAYTGLGISMWPMIVPPDITIWEAASPRSSQLFMLVGAAVLIPVILAYTAYVYWLFRGKIKAGQGYH